jgi:hypothetical protein
MTSSSHWGRVDGALAALLGRALIRLQSVGGTADVICRVMTTDARDNPCLVFLHIPKTAGQTLHFVALRKFEPHETIHLNSLGTPIDDEMERIPRAARERARLVWGNLPYGVHEHIPRPCEYLTILREPVSRVISVYKHILNATSHVLHRRITESRMGLEEYVESRIDAGQTENSQTRQLSGRQFGSLERDALEEARSHLQRFLVVGLTERIEETFVLLRRSLGGGLMPYVTRNVSPSVDVTQRAVQLVRDRNELDIDLYTFAERLLTEQIRRQGRSFQAEVGFYRALRPASRVAGRAADAVRGRR